MRLLAIVAYATAACVFVALIVTQSQKFTSETVIETTDVTGVDGWTCQMISKVNALYSVDGHVEPKLNYALVNVMESYSQCQANVQATMPCNATVFVYGTSAEFDITPGANYEVFELVTFGGALFYFLSELSSPFPRVPYVSNISSGEMNQAVFYGFNGGSGLGVDDRGLIYTTSGGTIFQSEGTLWTPLAGSPGAAASDMVLYQDNLNQLYYTTSCNVFALDAVSGSAVITLVYNASVVCSGTDEIASLAVYNPGSGGEAIEICFTVQNTTSAVTYCYATSLTTATTAAGDSPLAMDSSGSLYHLTANQVIKLNITSGDTELLFTAPSIAVLKCLVIAESAGWISTTNEAQLYYYSLANGTVEAVSTQSGFSVQWFICGDAVVSDIPTEAVASYGSSCQHNGVVGSTLFQDSYLFTPSAMQTYAQGIAQPSCSEFYVPMCDTISDLPPYSCTRRVYLGPFQILSTAIANAELLLIMLIVMFGVLLEKLALCRAGAISSEAPSSKEDTQDVNISGADVEMVQSDSDNPILK